MTYDDEYRPDAGDDRALQGEAIGSLFRGDANRADHSIPCEA